MKYLVTKINQATCPHVRSSGNCVVRDMPCEMVSYDSEGMPNECIGMVTIQKALNTQYEFIIGERKR